jgi:hypothetical protein
VASSTAEAPGAPSGALTWLDQEVIEVWMPAEPSSQWVQRRSGRIPYQWLRPGDERLARDNGLLDGARVGRAAARGGR